MPKIRVEAKIENYPVFGLFTYSRHQSLTLFQVTDGDGGEPRLNFEPSLIENSTKVNPLTGKALVLPAFLVYTSIYNVNALIVYANFGTAEDFSRTLRRKKLM